MTTTRNYKGVTIDKVEMMGQTKWVANGETYEYLADAKNAIDNGNKHRKWSQ